MDLLWWKRWIWIAADTQARDDDEFWLDEEANSCIEPDGEWMAMDDRERVGGRQFVPYCDHTHRKSPG
jgi:hypothetical protein